MCVCACVCVVYVRVLLMEVGYLWGRG